MKKITMRFDVMGNSNNDVCCSYDTVEDVLDQLDIYEEDFCENLEDDSTTSCQIHGSVV